MPMSTYAANAMLNLYLRGVAPAVPAGVYVSLHTADPGNTGANEVSTAAWPAYVREHASQGGAIATGFAAAANKASENLLEMLWLAQNGGAAVTVTHFGLWDASTGGNFLFAGPLTANKTLNPTDECIIHSGDLDLTVT
ncbi:head protein [Sinorhizobium phage PBC5]|uniref:head protein n=1 Tax=Sinorhizobium phage PBC5 TaxID=179237 RepID=UPI001BE56FD5|nr:head protein [Sinorhizobium phage PBC5]